MSHDMRVRLPYASASSVERRLPFHCRTLVSVRQNLLAHPSRRQNQWRFLALLRRAPLPISMGKLDLGPKHVKMGAPAVCGGNLKSQMLIL